MFGSTIIDVVIGLSFLYILLSLVCTSLGELILGNLLDMRASDLEKGIRWLLGDALLADQFYEHPIIRSLSAGKKSQDYIPARTFALVLLDIVLTSTRHNVSFPPGSQAASPGDYYAGSFSDFYSVNKLIAGFPSESPGAESLRRVLLDLCDESGGDLSALREGIARWYDDCMDRVAGVYKRRVQLLIVITAAVITILINADTIGIAQAIWNTPFLRETLSERERVNSLRETPIAQATPYPRPIPIPASSPTPGYEQRPAPTTVSASTNAPATSPSPTTGFATPTQANANNASAAPTPTPSPPLDYYRDVTDSSRRSLATIVGRTQFPLGWSVGNEYVVDDPRNAPTTATGWMLKALGWMLTVMVVSLGAPVWFDLLNKFTVIRSTVKPREKSAPPPSKDRPTSSMP